ncbi:unnamed protein product [Prorocentrum cordatum]|uniref:Uncharacterized protein n=2 Tax=Prorocentrum cordatum TaxID=2364126 RepID=A0ABN9RBW0_9DINO|nr:unnamed protein product [Polarella glacialis]
MRAPTAKRQAQAEQTRREAPPTALLWCGLAGPPKKMVQRPQAALSQRQGEGSNELRGNPLFSRTSIAIGKRGTCVHRRKRRRRRRSMTMRTRAASTERKTERATPSPSPRRPAARDREPGAARHAPRRGARQSPAPILRV